MTDTGQIVNMNTDTIAAHGITRKIATDTDGHITTMMRTDTARSGRGTRMMKTIVGIEDTSIVETEIARKRIAWSIRRPPS